ncbi:PAAR domain-containing protein [Streptomyces sp. NPDC014623]|uniref:PAAR domain-containing protein n=1 Tax=Streptomyces sp. NPDC014623 TaxID=3364875 RepID=UPI0036F86487
MPAAARSGDATTHGGRITTPPPSAAATVARVLIGGRPAAVMGSLHVCPMPPHAVLGPANVLTPGPAGLTAGVLIGGLPAAQVGDKAACGAQIIPPGAPDVVIGGAL